MNILIVNWGIYTAEFPLRESINLNRHQIYLATTRRIPKSIKRLFDKKRLIFTNPYNPIILVGDVVRFCKEKRLKFDVVTTFFELAVFQAAFLADYFNCKKRLLLVNALQTSGNKYLMRKRLQEVGIRQPRFFCFDGLNINKAYDFHKTIAVPIVIKPVHSGHSHGARIIEQVSKKKFQNLYKEAVLDFKKDFCEWMIYLGRNRTSFLAEEFIGGNVYSFDGVVGHKGLVKFIGNIEFEMADSPSLQQISHTVPIASLTKTQIGQCEDYVRDIILALGLQYCGFHCELKIYKNKPYLIEISGRLPGGEVLKSHQAASKINIFDLFFSIFEGKERAIKKNKTIFLSESFKAVYKTIKPGKVISVPNKRGVFKKCSYRLDFFLRKGEVVKPSKEKKMWLFNIKIRSKFVDSKKIVLIREELIKKIKDDFQIDNSVKLIDFFKRKAGKAKRSLIESFKRA